MCDYKYFSLKKNAGICQFFWYKLIRTNSIDLFETQEVIFKSKEMEKKCIWNQYVWKIIKQREGSKGVMGVAPIPTRTSSSNLPKTNLLNHKA